MNRKEAIAYFHKVKGKPLHVIDAMEIIEEWEARYNE